MPGNAGTFAFFGLWFSSDAAHDSGGVCGGSQGAVADGTGFLAPHVGAELGPVEP